MEVLAEVELMLFEHLADQHSLVTASSCHAHLEIYLRGLRNGAVWRIKGHNPIEVTKWSMSTTL